MDPALHLVPVTALPHSNTVLYALHSSQSLSYLQHNS